MASMLGKSTGLNPEEGFLWVREAAYGGLAGAQFVMGKMRLAGVQGILTMDEEEGESWLVSAAIGDHPEAKLLCVERFGVGPATENLLAIGPVWAKELADEDHPVGLHAFGLVLAELADPGLGEEGLLPCIAPLSAAAQAGYAPALHDLALVLLAAPGLSTKDMDPNVLLRQAVAADYAPAFHDLADLLVAKPELADVVFSIGTVLQRGIELGDLRCQSSVGLLALQGLWQGIEAELCLEWVEDGAIAGILDPGVFLAERAAIQFHPEDVENTIDYLYEAEAWLESLAELGDPDALWELVKFHDQYAQYLELEIDFRFNEYLAAASAGSVEAQMQVGNIYLSGYESIPKDSIEATRWIKSAIAAGGEAAVESLAQCYESGNGVPFWPEQAIRLRNLFGLTNEISGEK
ncbi:MAG: sel1 repeat family protein [Planctomycetes bacterium]|nr:sel1 repeat family protein [Planctomycetota bacterium]